MAHLKRGIVDIQPGTDQSDGDGAVVVAPEQPRRFDGRILNRELSWLEFNARVLELAAEPGIPLLDRARFMAIFSSNLDEFFQVRVAALRDQIAAGIETPSADGRTPLQQMEQVGTEVSALIARQEELFVDVLLPGLAAVGVHLVRWEDLRPAEQGQMTEYYMERIYPVLTPLAVDPGHPFPYISDLALSIAATVADPVTAEKRFVRLKVPDLFPRLLEVGNGRLLPAEDLIAAHLHTLFSGMEVTEWSTFRVTRNADLTLEEEEAEDLLEAVEMELRRRRFKRPVRLEVSDTMSASMMSMLVRELDLDERNVSRHRTLLDLGRLEVIASLNRPELKWAPWPPVTAGRLVVLEDSDRSIFSVIRDRALLLHHPYESFASSVEAFIAAAADDPRVQSIKMTLYRAGGDSPIIKSLIRAAERGVQVAVLVELKARFDEAINVQWARQLERAGVHVVYGMVGLKTHCKVALVVRDDGDQLRRYCHIGTGNYNSRTARTYEDLGYVTCDQRIGADAGRLFNHLTGYSRSDHYDTLIVAPRDLRERLYELIERESAYGSEGRIMIKCNSIADTAMIEALYRASAAGVRIELIVRGVCCVRAGVPGLSENITVRSVLGRYLEHSRIYRFAHGRADGEVLHLIGSADLMPRNLDRRVEVLVPIEHPKHQEWLDQTLQFLHSDDVVRWELGPDDIWYRRGPRDHFSPDAQELMYRWAAARQMQTRFPAPT